MEGHWGKLGELYDKVPTGLVEMVGYLASAQRVETLFEELGVSSVDGLKIACEENLLAELQGLVKSRKYLDGIDYQGGTKAGP